MRDLGREALPIVADVSRRQDVQQAVAQGLERFGRVDVLVNNAGIQPPIGPLVENDPDAWTQAVAVNLFGTFHCIQAVLPGMMARGAARSSTFRAAARPARGPISARMPLRSRLLCG